MGIFSFLTGNKPAEGADPPSLSARSPSSFGEAGATAAVVDDAASSERGAPSGTTEGPSSYSPPEGFDTSSLTAPLPAAADAPKVGPADPATTAELQSKIIEQIKTVYDPEIPVDIYELGLIYEIVVDAERRVLINMTLTSPACPSAQQIPSEVRYKVKAVPGVTDAWVEIVWDPPWTKERMSEAAKLALGFF